MADKIQWDDEIQWDQPAAEPTGVPMASAVHGPWDPLTPEAPGVDLNAMAQRAAMEANRRSGWDPAKTYLNAAALGQRPRIRALTAALAPTNEEDRAAAGDSPDFGTRFARAKAYFEQDQAAAAAAIPAIPRALLGLAGGVTALPAVARVAGSPTAAATSGMAPGGLRALLRTVGGVGESAAVNAGLAAAGAPEGRAGEAALAAAKSPLNLLGAVPGAVEGLRGAVAPWLAERAARRAYAAAGETTGLNTAARRFDPTGQEAVDPGRLAMGERLRDAPILKAGMTPSEVDTSIKTYRDLVGEQKGALVQQAEKLGAHPDYGQLRQSLADLVTELNSPAVRAVHGNEPGQEMAEFLRRLDQEYAPIPSQPLAMTEGGGAQPPGTRLMPGASPYANEQGLIPPPRQVSTGVYGEGMPPATPATVAEMESGGAPQLGPTGQTTRMAPGETFGAPKLVWTDPQNRRSFSEWEALKTEIQRKIDNTRAGFAPGAVNVDTPGMVALRKASGKINAADESALASVMPDKIGEYQRLKREYGIMSEAATAAKAKAERPPEKASVGYEGRHMGTAALTGALAGSQAGHGALGAGAGALAGLAGEALFRKIAHADPTMTRLYDALSRGAGAVPGTTGEVDALVKYLRNRE